MGSFHTRLTSMSTATTMTTIETSALEHIVDKVSLGIVRA